MFDLGIQELIVIFIVALLVFGPKRLPELGRTIGKGIGELKRAVHGVKEQMDSELNELKQPILFEEKSTLDDSEKDSPSKHPEQKYEEKNILRAEDEGQTTESKT